MRFTALILAACLLWVTTPAALAAEKTYEVELLITQGKKTKETDSVLTFREKEFSVLPDKDRFKDEKKQFAYKSIESADYSYSKKPLLSMGGAVTSVILLGLASVPLFFMKKKRHWLTVKTKDDFAVIKLQKDNFRQILAEFETKGVKIITVVEDDDDKKKEKEQNGEKTAEPDQTEPNHR